MRDPGKRSFHNSSARQYYKPLRWQQLLPIDLHTLVQPLFSPCHKHFFWGRLARTLDEIHTPSKFLLRPVLALVLAPVASIHPYRCLRRGNCVSACRSSVLIPSQSITLALWTFALSTKPSVSTSRWRLRPLIFFAPS